MVRLLSRLFPVLLTAGAEDGLGKQGSTGTIFGAAAGLWGSVQTAAQRAPVTALAGFFINGRVDSGG